MTPDEICELHERLGDEYARRCLKVGLKEFPDICWSTSPDGTQTIAIVFIGDPGRVLRGPREILPRIAFDLVMESRCRTN